MAVWTRSLWWNTCTTCGAGQWNPPTHLTLLLFPSSTSCMQMVRLLRMAEPRREKAWVPQKLQGGKPPTTPNLCQEITTNLLCSWGTWIIWSGQKGQKDWWWDYFSNLGEEHPGGYGLPEDMGWRGRDPVIKSIKDWLDWYMWLTRCWSGEGRIWNDWVVEHFTKTPTMEGSTEIQKMRTAVNQWAIHTKITVRSLKSNIQKTED
jgi:hypothetical protein